MLAFFVDQDEVIAVFILKWIGHLCASRERVGEPANGTIILTDVRATTTVTRALIGGMEIEAFHREIREIRAFRFASAISRDQLNELYGLARLEETLGSDASVAASVDIYDDGRLVRLADMQRKSGKSYLRVVADSFRKGSTIRVRELDQSDARLRSFVEEIEEYFVARSQINLYLTPPGRSGFPPHFDTTDVFVVQVLGSKGWRLFDQYTNQVKLPLPEINWDPDRFRPLGAAESIRLSAGDVLYLPRGVMHEAYCEDRESLHLTISIAPLTVVDLLNKVVRAAAVNDVLLRQRVPWDIQPEELKRRLVEGLSRIAEQMDVAPLLEEERSSVLRNPGGADRGELLSAVRSLLES